MNDKKEVKHEKFEFLSTKKDFTLIFLVVAFVMVGTIIYLALTENSQQITTSVIKIPEKESHKTLYFPFVMIDESDNSEAFLNLINLESKNAENVKIKFYSNDREPSEIKNISIPSKRTFSLNLKNLLKEDQLDVKNYSALKIDSDIPLHGTLNFENGKMLSDITYNAQVKTNNELYFPFLAFDKKNKISTIISILNTEQKDADNVEFTLYFQDKDPVTYKQSLIPSNRIFVKDLKEILEALNIKHNGYISMKISSNIPLTGITAVYDKTHNTWLSSSEPDNQARNKYFSFINTNSSDKKTDTILSLSLLNTKNLKNKKNILNVYTRGIKNKIFLSELKKGRFYTEKISDLLKNNNIQTTDYLGIEIKSDDSLIGSTTFIDYKNNDWINFKSQDKPYKKFIYPSIKISKDIKSDTILTFLNPGKEYVDINLILYTKNQEPQTFHLLENIKRESIYVMSLKEFLQEKGYKNLDSASLEINSDKEILSSLVIFDKTKSSWIGYTPVDLEY